MYDRKTWVILALCGALLSANLYYSNKNRIEQERIRAKQQALQKSLTPPIDTPVTTTAGLTVETPPPPTEEQTVVLQNKEVIFTLSNIGGGIKIAELKNQFQVGSKTKLVQINHFGAGPIGGLADAEENLLNIPAYTYKAEDSVDGKKAVFIARASLGTDRQENLLTWSSPTNPVPATS